MNNERIHAKYLIEPPHGLEHAATVLAGEQSSGSFVSLRGETLELKERFGARVESIEPLDTVSSAGLPGSKAPKSAGGQMQYRRGLASISFPLRAPAEELVEPTRANAAIAGLLDRARKSLASGRSLVVYSASGPDDPSQGATRARACLRSRARPDRPEGRCCA